jgi:hypothetical protein
MLRNYRNVLVALTRRCLIRNRCCARWNNNRSPSVSFGHGIIGCLNIVRSTGRQ